MKMQEMDPSQRMPYPQATMLIVRLCVSYSYVDSHTMQSFDFDQMVDTVAKHATLVQQDACTLDQAMKQSMRCLQRAYATMG